MNWAPSDRNTNGRNTRKVGQPWVIPGLQPWTNDWVVSQHTEALYLVGEPCLFTLMWRPIDHEMGLVDLCPSCSVSRSAEAFNQPQRKKCLVCYGTTFEGGIRAQVIRPAMFNDRNVEMTDTQRGTVSIDTLQVETTPDFVFRKGDYIFRADGSRYQGEEKGEGVLRTGFALPDGNVSFRGTIPSVRLEETTAVAYILPPDTEDLIALLRNATSEDLHGMPGIPAQSSLRTFVFIGQEFGVVEHNLGMRVPGTVVVTDMDDDVIMVAVDYLTDNTLRVDFGRPTSFKVWVKP